jgi:hypothetical protein
MNEHDVEEIAASLHVLRPDWPSAQIRTLIRDHLQDRPRRDVLVALSWVAGDSASHTPYRVLQNGPWWKAAAADRTTIDPADRTDSGLLCAICLQPEHRCRRAWSEDHDYVSVEEHQALVADTDPMIRALQVRDLKRLVTTFGEIPGP